MTTPAITAATAATGPRSPAKLMPKSCSTGAAIASPEDRSPTAPTTSMMAAAVLSFSLSHPLILFSKSVRSFAVSVRLGRIASPSDSLMLWKASDRSVIACWDTGSTFRASSTMPFVKPLMALPIPARAPAVRRSPAAVFTESVEMDLKLSARLFVVSFAGSRSSWMMPVTLPSSSWSSLVSAPILTLSPAMD